MDRLLYRYAVPLFIRVQQDMEVTSTFKQTKLQLVNEGFNPANITDKLYYKEDVRKCYVPLDTELHQYITAGKSKL